MKGNLSAEADNSLNILVYSSLFLIFLCARLLVRGENWGEIEYLFNRSHFYELMYSIVFSTATNSTYVSVMVKIWKNFELFIKWEIKISNRFIKLYLRLIIHSFSGYYENKTLQSGIVSDFIRIEYFFYFQILHPANSEEWTLQILFTKQEDTGWYECQINTHKTMAQPVYLKIISEYIHFCANSKFHVLLRGYVEMNDCNSIIKKEKRYFLKFLPLFSMHIQK